MALKIPDDYIPRVFRIAKARNWKVLLVLLVIYAVQVGLFYPELYPRKPVLGTWPKILGAAGDVLSLIILLFSLAVDRYSSKRYLRLYTPQAKIDHPSWSQVMIQEHLLDYHAKLKMLARNVLTSEVGATLLAISTIVAVFADFL